jgi:hypothetical protein
MKANTMRPDSIMDEDQVKAIIGRDTTSSLYREKKVLVLALDTTRTAPVPMMRRAIEEVIGERAARLVSLWIMRGGAHRLEHERLTG